MKPKILLVNPPVYDFAAYDFWLKPYGLMRVGGQLRKTGKLYLFDYLDRHHPAFDPRGKIRTDHWGRGPYPAKRIKKPACFKGIPRYYRRFGMDRLVFRDFLKKEGPFDVVLIQTVMTYWYPGVQEAIEDVRRFCPRTKIVLGGFYATACREHAASLDADLVISGDKLNAIESLGLTLPTEFQPPAWDLFPRLSTGVITLTRGCPFRCSYCYTPQLSGGFSVRPLEECIAELDFLTSKNVQNIAFYDDALLYQPETIFLPFLEAVIKKNLNINFHTPNALHARYITADIAKLMVAAGFKTFYLGYESRSEDFHRRTNSGKVISEELARAVHHLKNAGAEPARICAYEMLGHPRTDIQQLEMTMKFANGLGIRMMLSDFSPIPGTPDGDLCRSVVDLSEPLNHNKTAFPIRFLGVEKVNYYKQMCNKMNDTINWSV